MLSSDPNKTSLQWKNNSGELDVFEAARYFSTVNNDQNSDNYLGQNFNNVRKSSTRARMSLDLVPMQTDNDYIPIHHHVALDQKMIIKESSTKHKQQPTSPGGRLASFLNSFFNNQRHVKAKKKSKPDKDFEDENTPGLRRKRRSSISHFIRITTSSTNINHHTTIASSSSSSSTSSAAAANYANRTPTKQVISLPKNTSGMDYECMEEKSRISNGVFSEKISRDGSFGFSSNNSTVNQTKFSDADDDNDGADSDSSSDLFDLPNHDLDFCTNDLPVYETTHVNTIKNIAKPISRATAV